MVLFKVVASFPIMQDEEEAVVYLRKSGIARAAKAAGREAREGVIAVSISSDEAQCTAVMLNCETDFVQKNPKFVAFSRALAEHCRSTLQPDDITPSLGARESALIEQLKSSRPSYNLSSCVQRDSTAPANSVNELLADLTTQFGEKVEVSAVECMGSDASSCIGVYVHNEATPGVGVGRAAAMVELRWDLSSTSATPATVLRERLSKFARLMAMQVVASSPKFVDLNSIPSSTVEEERSIAEETSKAAAAAGTKGAAEPKDSSASETKETMPSKIAAQRMQRYLQEQCLVFQEFLMIKQLYNDVLSDIQAETATQSTGSRSSSKTNNQPITVADALQLVGKTLGCTLTVSRMRLITVGSQ
ncbi:elongation factor ts, putative [Eimeria praecox]|uniref:Elongation factor Ts, mitochondrial n=1 Tax=Eimeria praecox TaxID=51316 RepID=U6G5V9_9EIME|nr:elongation factor ts, putative [Eimeria praecox]